jgi:hypothetical protein
MASNDYPEGWFVNPSDRSVAVLAAWLARQKVRQYRAYMGRFGSEKIDRQTRPAADEQAGATDRLSGVSRDDG